MVPHSLCLLLIAFIFLNYIKHFAHISLRYLIFVFAVFYFYIKIFHVMSHLFLLVCRITCIVRNSVQKACLNMWYVLLVWVTDEQTSMLFLSLLVI